MREQQSVRQSSKFGLHRYRSDSIGGKGGTRTLDPGIMSRAQPTPAKFPQARTDTPSVALQDGKPHVIAERT